MYYSYVMGVDKSINILKKQGFTIKKDRGNYKVSFSESKANIFEHFITENLQVGFWNEYLKDDCVVFIFKLQDCIRRYEVYDFDNSEVLCLCEKLCNCKFGSIKDMLIGNKCYKKILSNR